MPVTYSNAYVVSEVSPGVFQVTGVVVEGSSIDVTDGGPTSPVPASSGDNDEILEAGESVVADSGSGPQDVGPYVGSVNGDSVVVDSGADNVLFTNTTFLVGDPVTISVGADLPVCFGAGTMIATPDGEKAVETLEIGDIVTTAEGRAVPVKWVGRQTMVKMFAGHSARPVRVSAGALGNGLPHSDLVLTADHALIIDGMAINAGALVNGTTITVDAFGSLADRVTYYHVETEGHDVILANGAAAETFVDYVTRSKFDNYAEYVDLYGEERAIDEMLHVRISTSRLVPAEIKARLAADKVA